jgi:hypothetical protein
MAKKQNIKEAVMARKRNSKSTEELTIKKRGHRPKPNKPILNYESWWTVTRKKHDFPAYMKEVLYRHFQSRGFLANGRYDEGLADFGIKV